MDDVPLCRLGELLTLERRPVEVVPDADYAEIGIYSFGRGIFHKPPRSGFEVGNKKLFLIREGDFIFHITFAWEGAVGLASKAEDGMYGSVRFPTFRVNENRCFPPYLLNYFRTEVGRDQLVKISPGSAGRNRVLSLKRLPEILTPLPPLDEQRRIVARIEELAALIEEARELRHHAVEEVASFVSSLHLKLAQGRTVKLDEILQLDECRETVQPDGKYPQVGIKGSGQGLFAKAALDGTQTKYKAFNRLYEGAVVLSQPKGWEGAIGVCPPELAGRYASPEYRTFRCIPGKAMPEYLAVVFATPWFWTRLKNVSRGLGARRQRTRPEQFLKMELPMPIVDQQQHAIAIFNDLRELTVIQDATQAELDALLPSVLDQAFRGEL
jgi:type I restriction enzyme S subunit